MNTTLIAVCSLVVRLLKGGSDLAAARTKAERRSSSSWQRLTWNKVKLKERKRGDEFKIKAERATLSFISNVGKRCFLSSLLPASSSSLLFPCATDSHLTASLIFCLQLLFTLLELLPPAGGATECVGRLLLFLPSLTTAFWRRLSHKQGFAVLSPGSAVEWW